VLLGLLLVFGLEWLEADILRTPESVERTLGLPVMGAIPADGGSPARASKRGVKTTGTPQAIQS